MISMIIKSYLTILIGIGAGALLMLIAGIFTIIRFFNRENNTQPAFTRRDPVFKLKAVSTDQDIAAIAGDDIIATQLDLARAYLEIGNHSAAAKLLEMVAGQGNPVQQEEAKTLSSQIADFKFVEHVKKRKR